MTLPLPWYAYLIIAILCAVNWTAAYLEKMKLYYVTKPLALMAMISFFAWCGGYKSTLIPFLIGLSLSLIGDVLLIPQRTRFFLMGMGAFALAHVAYIYGFSQWAVSYWMYIPTAVVLVVLLLVFSFYIKTQCADAKLPSLQKHLFKVYGALIGIMALMAWMSLAREGWLPTPAVIAGLGGSFFVVSDLMIALGKLEKTIPKQRFWVIVCYHVAQLFILSSVLLVNQSV